MGVIGLGVAVAVGSGVSVAVGLDAAACVNTAWTVAAISVIFMFGSAVGFPPHAVRSAARESTTKKLTKRLLFNILTSSKS